MNNIMIPVNGSKNSDLAVAYAAKTYGQQPDIHFYVCNVQPTLNKHTGRFLSKKMIQIWQAERAAKAVESSINYLERMGVRYSFVHVSGDKGTALQHEAERLDCNRIVIGTAKKNTLTRLFENSTTVKLLETSNIPVEVVTGKTLPLLERWGIPTVGLSTAGVLMAMVMD